MTLIERIITIALASITNFLTRVLPFAIFTRGDRQKPADFVVQLGKFLPVAIMTLLVVYCYRDVHVLSTSGLPAIIAGIITAGIHIWRQQMFLSLIVGTAAYMVLLNLVF